jgi:hypothetical protein
MAREGLMATLDMRYTDGPSSGTLQRCFPERTVTAN